MASLSSLSQNWEYDVFPSFHGKDVRQTFLSHVLKEFNRKGINFFIDNEIKRGEFIGPELKRAIRESKIAVVLLSKNYASSSWCLDELVEIMKKELGQTVITIFYEVDPTDVKKQKGDFGKVFKKTCKGKGKEKVQTWRKALEGVATIAGYHSSNWVDEAAMIENIAADISNKLNHLAPSRDFNHLIGMGAHMERMRLLLRLDLGEVRMIGIWGPAGIGKTTIARFLFNQISGSFQNTAFMVNIKGMYPRRNVEYDEYDAQLKLQKEMLSEMINQKDIIVSHLGVAEGRLRRRTVLLVLDDVDRLAQLDALAKNVQWFGPGSRIIITTEDLRLLKAHRIDHIYKVNFPSTDEALQMFCMYAFDQKSPKDGFELLACEITSLVGELPLGLKVMASYFRGLSKERWSMEVSRLRTNLSGDIESILKFSYDALCDEDKYLFLHIACFFNNNTIERVEEFLAERFKDLRHRLYILEEKSLISMDYGGASMHNLLVQLGKEIARKASVCEPRQPHFLTDYKDICQALTTITGVVIDRDSTFELNKTKKAFEEMSCLQFLRVEQDIDPNIISPQGPLTFISAKLRLLHWSYCPMTCLRFTNNLEFLVELLMDDSKLEKLWDGIKLLPNLKRMNLSHSRNLKELPDLSMATSLKELNLTVCSSLVELSSSIRNATNLCELILRGCSSLVSLPQLPDSLRFLDAENCESLEKLDCSFCNPDICVNFAHCYNLNKEARDLIILQTSLTLESVVLPSKEVPACFTFKASGSSITVKLNQKHLRTSTKFKACILFVNIGKNYPHHAYWDKLCVYCTEKNKACILLDNKGEHEVGIQERGSVSCRIKAKDHSPLLQYYPILTEHLYIFEVEAEEVTSTELVFYFEFNRSRMREIKECGIIQLLDHHIDGNEEMCERRSDQL